MTSVLIPVKQAHRVHARGSLLSMLEKTELPDRVRMAPGNRLIVQTKSWGSYWEPVSQLGLPQVDILLAEFRQVWKDYISSQFDRALRREYCFQYFSFLETLLKEYSERSICQLRRRALQCVLGFECFGIELPNLSNEPLAAATTTLRNPCYLLTKLKTPNVLDSAEFLPLITLANEGAPKFFYHYRRHKLSVDSENSVLLYLHVSVAERSKSFHIANTFEQQISHGSDPFGNERAKRIAHGIIIPYLKGYVGGVKGARDKVRTFELLDLGAGSGILAARVCHHVKRFLSAQSDEVSFCVWMQDLSLSEPKRFFAAKSFRRFADCIAAIGSDYRDWLSKKNRLPHCNGIRVGLVSRFLNNLSAFSITSISPKHIPWPSTSKTTNANWKECLPGQALRHDAPGPSALVVSNSRILLETGRSFVQPSLSHYFQGIYLLSCSENSKADMCANADRVFLPLRSFCQECLLTNDGTSIFDKMLEDCSLVIIQDADLRPQDLIAHRECIRLLGIDALDMTKALGFKGHYSYVLFRQNDLGRAFLKGCRLW